MGGKNKDRHCCKDGRGGDGMGHAHGALIKYAMLGRTTCFVRGLLPIECGADCEGRELAARLVAGCERLSDGRKSPEEQSEQR